MDTANDSRKAKRTNLIAAGLLLLALAAVCLAAAVNKPASEPVPGSQDEARRIIVYTTTSVI